METSLIIGGKRTTWCSQNNLELNALKTVEMVVDFRKNTAPLTLKWELNIGSLIKKAQQRMYFLRQLKKFILPKTKMVHFYSAIFESILTSSITIWYAAVTAKDRCRLQRIIRTAEKVIARDTFTFSASTDIKPFTRRKVLSMVNSVFDPLGFLTPVTIQGRTLLRELNFETSE